MKKPNLNRIIWEIRQQRKIIACQIWKINVRRHKSMTGGDRSKTAVISIPVPHAEKIESRKKIQQVLDSAWTTLRKGSSKLKLDFSRTHKIFPGGMLLLLANIALMLELFPNKVQAKCPPKSMAAQLLRHFGYADRLGVSPASSQPNHKDVVTWQYVTGTNADGSLITELLKQLRSDTGNLIPDGLYDVLTEALTNVSNHAYPAEVELPTGLKRWWLFSRLDRPTHDSTGNLYIGVYDMGAGIQNTMRNRLEKSEELLNYADWSDWWKWPRKLLDKRLLTEAVERKRSSTGLPFRGNGLPEMKDFVALTDSGRMSIISGHAQYTYSVSGGGNGYQCDVETLGTLILWNIPLIHKQLT